MFTKKDVLQTYKKILKGERKNFVRGTWMSKNAKQLGGYVLKYLIEEKLKLKRNEFLDLASCEFFMEYHLGTVISKVFNNSPYEAINYTYPGLYKPWEFRGVTPRNFWNNTTAKEATRWLVLNRLKLTKDRIYEVTVEDFKSNGLNGLISTFYGCSTFKALIDAFPEDFIPYKCKRMPRNYWDNDDNVLNALHWFFKDCLMIEPKDLSKIPKIKFELFCKYKLGFLISSRFNSSTNNAIKFYLENFMKKNKKEVAV